MLSNKRYPEPGKWDRQSRRDALLANEDGSVIVLALIMLMLLTMVGTSATNTATLENQVAGNERRYKQNFARTENAAAQGAQNIQEAPSSAEAWMRNSTFSHTNSPRTNFDNMANWVDLSGFGSEYSNTSYLVVYTGPTHWSTQDDNGTQIHGFSVYGQRRDPATNETMIIQTGFARRML
ncbi:MAG: hypothetical protein GY697_14545 [Desulfobacterales bacterium]|nr:hypothetical protein [Desulfobacterales bacterium]